MVCIQDFRGERAPGRFADTRRLLQDELAPTRAPLSGSAPSSSLSLAASGAVSFLLGALVGAVRAASQPASHRACQLGSEPWRWIRDHRDQPRRDQLHSVEPPCGLRPREPVVRDLATLPSCYFLMERPSTPLGTSNET